ncbi:inorganic phosphate transporter [Helicobacter monodelphidis]|uniref:inorganic phosphate transporter n=1 Tax=Helicobacter sp. 15-1451 TaxID=2004995 RepID=UPI000DCF5E1A|nr:inorganic phosphate transporter [Helicobacter sp. 15-1451]RAX58923.1 inorganic phosphate transporter [Helicobacter sp. 15-1451]
MDSMRKLDKLEKATHFNRSDFFKLSFAILFILLTAIIALYYSSSIDHGIYILIVATMVGGYMAINIGANDVANNVGPAVGSKALTMGGAILIAAICEAGGAIIAGGDVVDTIRSGIVSPTIATDQETFINIMLAALISGAIWLHLATAVGAPVSTTHSIVGGILGAGIMAGGFDIVNWGEMGKIVSSWVISPLLGGGIAAAFLFFIKRTITYKEDKLKAAKTVVPLLLFVMSAAFSMYMISKGLKKVITLSLPMSIAVSLVIGIVVFLICRPLIAMAASKMDNTKEEVGKFFTIPLIFAAALLSFAHGTNDVANAIGPLAAINDTLKSIETGIATDAKATVPLWIMIVGGFGISLGLALYGPKLIRTVGSEITDLDQVRAFCVAMSAAVTVLVASALGLPVSSTHIAVGAVFGVGFLREGIKKHYYEIEQNIIIAHDGVETQKINTFLAEFRKAPLARKQLILKGLKQRRESEEALAAAGVVVGTDDGLQLTKMSELPTLSKKDQKQLKKAYKEELVKRSAFNKIVATWLITVPAAAILSGLTFLLLRWAQTLG